MRGISGLGFWIKQLGLWVFEGVALLVLGVLWVHESLSWLVVQLGKGQAASTVASHPAAAAAAAVGSAADNGLFEPL